MKALEWRRSALLDQSSGLVPVSSTVNAGLRTVVVRDGSPIAGGPPRFMRLRDTMP